MNMNDSPTRFFSPPLLFAPKTMGRVAQFSAAVCGLSYYREFPSHLWSQNPGYVDTWSGTVLSSHSVPAVLCFTKLAKRVFWKWPCLYFIMKMSLILLYIFLCSEMQETTLSGICVCFYKYTSVGKRSHRGSLTFMDICDCMVKDISIVNSRKRGQGLSSAQYGKNNVSLWTKIGQISWQPIIKDWGFINSGFLSCDTNSPSA